MNFNQKIENSLLVEKYRPKTLSEYIGNESVKTKVARYIENEDVPHLLLYGPAGTGKTTLGKIISNELPNATYLYINASDENSVDTIRTKVKNFASGASFANWKIIMLDEADFITRNGQMALRNIIESFSKNTRFILTCNYVEKIADPLQSRCTSFQIFPPSKKDIAKRLVHICNEENIEFRPEDIKIIIDKNYPDIRRVIMTLQEQSLDGKLTLDKASIIEVRYMDKIVEVLKSNKSAKDQYKELRQILADSKRRTFDELYTFLFENMDEYVPEGKRANIILEIAKGMTDDNMAIDKEINVTAMLIRIIAELKG